MHIYRIQRDGTDGTESICRAAMENRHRKETCGHRGEGEGGTMETVAWKHTQYHLQNRQPVRICCMTRELKLGLYDNLEEQDGLGGGKEAQEGGDIRKCMADSCPCMAETNTTL